MERSAFVLDTGSETIKVGFGGEDVRSAFPAVVGRTRYPPGMVGICGQRDYYVGDAAISHRGIMNLKYPISKGVVTDWDDFEKLLRYAMYNELRIAAEEHRVLMMEPPLSPKNNREKMMELMFETFDVPYFYMATQPVMSMYSSGLTTGVVVESGDGVTHAVPIFDGYTVPNGVSRFDVAGRDLTQYFMKLLGEQGNTADENMVKYMKEKVCYVAPDFEVEFMKASCAVDMDRKYELHDGQVLTIETERFRCPEAMFMPALIGRESQGIHEIIYESIMKCDIDLRKDLWGHIILAGGNTMLSGFAERLQNELTLLAPKNTRVKVIAAPERKYSAWNGGSILARLDQFDSHWISREEYKEHGLAIVHTKCTL